MKFLGFSHIDASITKLLIEDMNIHGSMLAEEI